MKIRANLISLFLILIPLASFAEADRCATKACVANQKPGDDVRQYAAIGTKNWSRRVLDKPSRGWFVREWNKVMRDVVNDAQSCAFDQHYPTLAAQLHWSDAYIDERIKPTRSQARNPNWSNYVWNKKETSSDFVYDGITDALNGSLVDNGRGIAKLALTVGLTATSGNLIPPKWMTRDRSLAWVEGKNANGKSDNWHVRFDNPQAVEHAADFLHALLAKYGNNRGLHSLALGEYYLGQSKYFPSGLDRNKYLVGVKNLWKKTIKTAPRDSSGKRINIVQTNPVFNQNVTLEDFENIGMGISESDTNLSFPVGNSKVTAGMRKLYDRKSVHVMIEGDARYACQGRRQRWDGTANPFGHKNGYRGVATPQEIYWYHGTEGPAPVHSFLMTIGYWCNGPQTKANFKDAIQRFGRCGSEASRWGVAPAAFSNKNEKSNIAASKPKAPEVVVH